MRLLMVEDDVLFGDAAQRALSRAGVSVDWVRRGLELGPAMRLTHYDCVLLDLNLPDVSGEDVLQALRSRDPGQSVIVVTARGGVVDRIRLLDQGADDYVTKPVDLEEIAARVRAVTRRVQRGDSIADLAHGPLQLQASRRIATWHGKEVALTNKEYCLLELLVRRRSQVHSRARLEEALGDRGEPTSSNIVEVHVHNLRRKLHKSIVRTVRGCGYQIGSEASLGG